MDTLHPPTRGAVPHLPLLRPGEFFVPPETLPEAGPVCYCEDTSDPFDVFGFRATRVLFQEQTPFQHVLIADLISHGRALFMDGVLQSAAFDEKLYHESLVHPAMLAHGAPRDVLIIGGGEGATLRETLYYPSVTSVVMVDIDGVAVDACKDHLYEWHRGGFRDPRVTLIHEDGRQYVENSPDFFDIAIIDVVDMLDNGPAQRIYTREFYAFLRRRLRPGGVVVVQGMEFSHVEAQQHAALVRTIRTAFPQVYSYRAAVPSFLAPWGFVTASDHFCPEDWTPRRFDAAIARLIGSDVLRHLDGNTLLAAFALCRETRQALALPGPILSDDTPYHRHPDVDAVDDLLPVYPAVHSL